MNKFFRFVLDYPSEVIICMAFAPLFLKYPTTTLANLFALASILLVWILWQLAKGNLLLNKLGAILVLVIFCLMYFLKVPINLSYPETALLVIYTIFIAFISFRYHPNEIVNRKFHTIMLTGLAVCALLPVVYSVTYATNIRSQQNKLRENAGVINGSMKTEAFAATAEIGTLASDSTLSGLIEGKKYLELLNYCQNQMVSKNLSYLTIIDSDGFVLARAHHPAKIGDDYKIIVSNFKDKFNVDNNLEIGKEDSLVFYINGQKITDSNNKLIAYIAAGNIVDEKIIVNNCKLSGIDCLLTIDGQIIADSQKSADNKILLQAILADEETKLIPDQIRIFGHNGKRFLVIPEEVSIANDQATNLLLISIDNSKTKVNVIVVAIFVLSLLLVMIYYHFKFRPIPIAPRHLNIFPKRIKLSSKIIMSISRVVANLLMAIAIVLIIVALMIKNADTYYQKTNLVEKDFDQSTITSTPPAPSFSIRTDKQYYKVGDKIDLVIMVQSLTNNIAAAQVNLNFLSSDLKALSYKNENSICDRVYIHNLDNTGGLVEFSCSLKSDLTSFKSSADAELVTLEFEIKKADRIKFSLDKNYSSIRYSDGNEVQSPAPNSSTNIIVSP